MTRTRAALDVAQELVAEALAFGRAFDEAGDVGEDELVLVEAHHAEVRDERGERVVGDLGLGRAHHRDQRRLARVREADERGVGEQLQLELQPPLFAVLALLGERRRAAGVRQEARVAAPADAALRRHPAVAVAHEVGEQLTVLAPHDRADRHVDDEIGAGRAVLLLARPVRARLRLAVRMVPEREQRGDVAGRVQPDVAAVAAVAAVGTALRHVRLAPERDDAGAAVAGLHVQLRHVDELGHPPKEYGCGRTIHGVNQPVDPSVTPPTPGGTPQPTPGGIPPADPGAPPTNPGAPATTPPGVAPVDPTERMPSVGQPPPPGTPPPPGYGGDDGGEGESNAKWWWLAVGAVVVIAIIILVLVLVNSGDDDDSTRPRRPARRARPSSRRPRRPNRARRRPNAPTTTAAPARRDRVVHRSRQRELHVRHHGAAELEHRERVAHHDLDRRGRAAGQLRAERDAGPAVPVLRELDTPTCSPRSAPTTAPSPRPRRSPSRPSAVRSAGGGSSWPPS